MRGPPASGRGAGAGGCRGAAAGRGGAVLPEAPGCGRAPSGPPAVTLNQPARARRAMSAVSEKAKKSLERVGLTSYETRAYAALLRSGGGLGAAALSKESGVPYSKVYEVLGTLAYKGWVGSDRSRPARYFAKSPSTGLEATKQRMDSEFAESSGAVLSELLPLYEGSGTSERPDIWFLSGTPNIAAKILEMVESCRSEVLIAVPRAGEALVRQALPKLRQLRERGVGVTVLTSDKMDRDALAALSRVVSSVRVRAGLFGGGIIADRRHVVILLGTEMSEASSSAGTVAIWADHPGLAVFARDYFEYLIKDAGEA